VVSRPLTPRAHVEGGARRVLKGARPTHVAPQALRSRQALPNIALLSAGSRWRLWQANGHVR
jgi:hypothetical protein